MQMSWNINPDQDIQLAKDFAFVIIEYIDQI